MARRAPSPAGGGRLVAALAAALGLVGLSAGSYWIVHTNTTGTPVPATASEPAHIGAPATTSQPAVSTSKTTPDKSTRKAAPPPDPG